MLSNQSLIESGPERENGRENEDQNESVPLLKNAESNAQASKTRIISVELLNNIDRTLRLSLSANTTLAILNYVFQLKIDPKVNYILITALAILSNLPNAVKNKKFSAGVDFAANSAVTLTALLELSIHISGLLVEGEWDLEHNLAQRIGFPLVIALPITGTLANSAYAAYKSKMIASCYGQIDKSLDINQQPIPSVIYQILNNYITFYKALGGAAVITGTFSPALERAVASNPALKYGRLFYPFLPAIFAGLAYPENNPFFKPISKVQRAALFLAYALMFIALFKDSITSGNYFYAPIITMVIAGLILFNTVRAVPVQEKNLSSVYCEGNRYTHFRFAPEEAQTDTHYPAPRKLCTII